MQVNVQTPLPPRDVVLKNYTNKFQFKNLLYQEILTDDSYLQTVIVDHMLTVTSEEPVPTQVHKGQTSAQRYILSS